MLRFFCFGAILALALVVAKEARELHIQTSVIERVDTSPLHLYLQVNPKGLPADAPIR
jgi:hypothetical protein